MTTQVPTSDTQNDKGFSFMFLSKTNVQINVTLDDNITSTVQTAESVIHVVHTSSSTGSSFVISDVNPQAVAFTPTLQNIFLADATTRY